MTLTEVAEKINAHLKRFEADPEINAEREPSTPGMRGLRRFFNAQAYRGGAYVCIIYSSYQGSTALTGDEARKYLAMLDGGYVGRHYEAFRETDG